MGPFDEAKPATNPNKERFIGLLLATNREGVVDLCRWLEDETDFFTAPASTRHHGAHEAGLLAHSLAVYDWLEKLAVMMPEFTTRESAIISALLHDLTKVNFYAVSQRNVKNEETGKWEKQPYYAINDQLPVVGHGAKSVILAQRFIRLTVEETMAIGHHMGAWGAADYTERQTLNQAMQIYPLILALQMADQAATFWEGK
jgi:hypothetical protein